jgi:prephenate dehydratase
MRRKVGYLGPPATFGEQAALLYAPDADLVPYTSHDRVVLAVQSGEADEGVAATENSLQGTVSETLDALLRAPDVFIRAELVLAVEQNLIAAPGTRLADIQIVMSHPQALGQCAAFLAKRLPHARLEAALSTAAAVQEAVRTPGTAAIGVRRAAEVHGGVVLAEGIQDAANNKTRFVVLARQDAPPTGDDKTSIAFTVPHRPGTLVEAMKELSNRGLNLMRIESRPSREQLGEYVFLIDFLGHRQDANVNEALRALQEHGARLLPAGRPLGSYPRFVEP